MSDVPVEPPVEPVAEPVVEPIIEPPAPDVTEPPLATLDAGGAVVAPIGVYPDDTEVRPTGGRINNSQRQIKLKTVPDKIIKRIADGT
jgi:hypothetical protein